jgi:hypothetical protein
MAMSYSYDLQAMVFDRMTELEGKTAPTALNLRDPKQLSMVAAQTNEQATHIVELEYRIEADAPKSRDF